MMNLCFVTDLVAASRYQEDCCILFANKKEAVGRKYVKFSGKKIPASRAVCILAHGEPGAKGLEAAHSCGNGHLGCVNPRHLRWATHKENQSDKVLHGTSTKGASNATAKLTEGDVREIRKASGTQASIARKYGISQMQVSRIKRFKEWGYLR